VDIAIIGGGAAGFFAAITVKENYPQASVVIFEKSKTVLAKVKVSGGGRCNLTNACSSIKELSEAYPRGEKALKRAFRVFDNQDAMQWFESRNVPLIIQEDNCVFPLSQDSQSIIDCFLEQTRRLNIKIELERGVKNLKKVGNKLQLGFIGGKLPPRSFDKVIVATGGSPKRVGLEWLEKSGHKIEDPVPSLFTFKMPDEPITELMGVVVDNTLVSIQGTKIKAEGPLLITHWGMSGPAILKLSAFGARLLSEKGYDFKVQVNWTHVQNQDLVVAELQSISANHPKKILANVRPYALAERLWSYLLQKGGLPLNKKWGELGKSGLNRLVGVLTNDAYSVKGRTQFREEFVTCGGVSLESIDFKTMQSKVCENLYFAGEVMDIDGITGGYNFQAAWTTAFIAAKLS
jgi:hypothetical protein